MSRLPSAMSHLRFGTVCLLAYVALSWAVRFDMRLGHQIVSLVYPLDTFSMYAPLPRAEASHLLVRDARGEVHRVTAFRAFACDAPVDGPAAACSRYRGIPYHYEDLANHIRRHPGPGDEAVELITRTWQLRPGAAPRRAGDCLVARCTVRR